jgi:hypothetical protein
LRTDLVELTRTPARATEDHGASRVYPAQHAGEQQVQGLRRGWPGGIGVGAHYQPSLGCGARSSIGRSSRTGAGGGSTGTGFRYRSVRPCRPRVPWRRSGPLYLAADVAITGTEAPDAILGLPLLGPAHPPGSSPQPARTAAQPAAGRHQPGRACADHPDWLSRRLDRHRPDGSA